MKLVIERHSGENIIVETDSFDAKDYEGKINDDKINVIEIGGVIISRIDVKLIRPLEE